MINSMGKCSRECSDTDIDDIIPTYVLPVCTPTEKQQTEQRLPTATLCPEESATTTTTITTITTTVFPIPETTTTTPEIPPLSHSLSPPMAVKTTKPPPSLSTTKSPPQAPVSSSSFSGMPLSAVPRAGSLLSTHHSPSNSFPVIQSKPPHVESHIHQKVSCTSRHYFPSAEHFSSFEEMKLDYERLRLNYELLQAIGLEQNQDVMLKKVLELTFSFLPCDSAAVLLPDEETGCFIARATKTKKPGMEVLLSNTVIRMIIRERAGIISSDVQKDARFIGADSFRLKGVRASMAVPCLHRGELLAIFVITSLQRTHAYNKKDLHLLLAIGSSVGQAIQNATLLRKMKKEVITRQQFCRLLSPSLAELVVSGDLKVEQGGKNCNITVLFADIRGTTFFPRWTSHFIIGFTSMSENMPANNVLELLNHFFEAMVSCAFKYNGTVDKFIGDCIMLLFGAPITSSDHATQAVKSACDMQICLEYLNQQAAHAGRPQISIGIGLNSGEVTAGYIGSSETMSYSVIGDNVNTASRLCSQAKAGEILISSCTRELIEDDSFCSFEQLPPLELKGKQKPVGIYRVRIL